MKICKVCAQSDMLCAACQKKLEDGQIKQAEVDFYRAVKELGVELVDVLERGNRLYVIADSNNSRKIIGPGGKTIRKISEQLGKQIKVLEKTEGTDKEVIEKLIGVPVKGVNTVYSPSESYKIRLDKKYRKMAEPLKSVVSEIIGKKITFVFE